MRAHTRVSLALTGLATVTALTISPTGASTATSPASASVAQAATGCHEQGAFEVCLTAPTPGQSDPLIENRIVELIDDLGPGDLLRASIFEWDVAAVADALVAADDRGATVKLVLDLKATEGAQYNYNTVDQADLVERVCQHNGNPSSCTNAPAGINHNKFFLFKIDDVFSVVQTSMNLTTGQRSVSQNLIRVIGDESTHDHYLEYWRRMRDLQSLNGLPLDNNGSEATSYLYPRTNDNIAGLLNRVTDCTTAHDKILVASSTYGVEDGARPQLSDRLVELHQMGCDVRVIYRVGKPFPSELTGPGRLPADRIRAGEMHDKILLIDAHVTPPGGTEAIREITLTGSHNFNKGSLVNANEAILRVGDPWVHDRYRDHFEEVWAASATP